MNQPWHQHEKVLRAQSVQELAKLTAEFAHSMGYGHHGYAVKLHEPAVAKYRDYHYFHDFRNEWGAHYTQLNKPEMRHSDARIMHAKAWLPANAWNCRGVLGYTRPDIARAGRRMVRMAGEFGMSAGITVPSWAPGVDWSFATFTTDATFDLRELAPTIAPAVYFVTCLQSRMNDLLDRRPEPVTLSKREREVLCWSAIGKTSWEISVLLQISERTVNFHLQRAANKLQVRGGRAACARALSLGLIAL